jgi:hypothetical protein
MLDILSELEREFSQSSSLVVVSGASDGDWTRALAGLQRRGVRVTAVMFDRASFGGQANDDAVQSLLMGGITTYRIRKGDATADALSAPVGGSARNARPDLAAMKRVRPHTPAPAEAPA